MTENNVDRVRASTLKRYANNKILDAHRVKSPADIPAEPHYAVFRYGVRTIEHEGDERSRTHPGHGYPAYTESISTVEHFVFVDAEEFKAIMVDLFEENPQRTDVIGYHVDNVVRPTVKVTFDVKV